VVTELLVAHGAWVWKAAALVIALLGLAVVRSARMTAARRRVRDEVLGRRRDVSAPVLAKAEGIVALSGTLRGGVASTLVAGTDVLHDRAGEVWVDYRGERLELAGPVHVLRGTSAVAARGVPRATPRGIREALARAIDRGSRVSRVLRRAAGGRVHRLEQVRDGDAVIVRGQLGGQTSGVDRFGLRSWTLAPVPDTREIEILAVAPDAPAVPMREPTALVLALAIAGAACGGMYLFGRHELAAGTATSLAIAAAMPGTRDDALAALAKQ
jgi:hypothetical protein